MLCLSMSESMWETSWINLAANAETMIHTQIQIERYTVAQFLDCGTCSRSKETDSPSLPQNVKIISQLHFKGNISRLRSVFLLFFFAFF